MKIHLGNYRGGISIEFTPERGDGKETKLINDVFTLSADTTFHAQIVACSKDPISEDNPLRIILVPCRNIVFEGEVDGFKN